MARIMQEETPYHFRHPFTLAGIELPAGAYWVTRRFIFVSMGGHERRQLTLTQIGVANPRDPSRSVLAEISEEDLRRALAEDMR